MLASTCSVFNRYTTNIMQAIEKVYIKYCLKFANCNFKNKQLLNINLLPLADSFKSDKKPHLKNFFADFKKLFKN